MGLSFARQLDSLDGRGRHDDLGEEFRNLAARAKHTFTAASMVSAMADPQRPDFPPPHHNPLFSQLHTRHHFSIGSVCSQPNEHDLSTEMAVVQHRLSIMHRCRGRGGAETDIPASTAVVCGELQASWAGNAPEWKFRSDRDTAAYLITHNILGSC